MTKLMETRSRIEEVSTNGGRNRLNVTIPAPNFKTSVFTIEGTSPYVQHKFWKKASMMKTQEEGSTNNKGKKREKRDFKSDFLAATYRTAKGEYGMPAPAFRNAMISACRTVGYKMTHAKLAAFVFADGYDKDDETPMVRIEGGP